MDTSKIAQLPSHEVVDELIRKHRNGAYLHFQDVFTLIDYTIALRNEFLLMKAALKGDLG